MALERVGLAGVMKFDSGSAVQAMRAPRDELGRFIATEKRASAESTRLTGTLGRMDAVFKKTASAIGRSADKLAGAARGMASAARGLGVAGLPLTAAVVAGAAAAANFEQKMDAVHGVLLNVSDEGMQRLTNASKEMGATTVFSASQSAEGLQLLARAGFDVDESISALPGVMNAAAADGINLATSADIVANTIRAMGLQSKDATDVADVLALASARANTDMVGLGEGMKFAAQQAKQMGVELPVVAASLGVLADSGLKGTLAGTSFTNMLVKLSKPSREGLRSMKELGASIFETADGSLDLRRTLASLAPGLSRIVSKTKRAAKITSIFGIRGQKAVGAIDQAITSGKFDKLVGQLENASGAAEKMAKIRLDNFKGQVTLLGSVLEGLAIEVFTPFLQNAGSGLKGITEAIGGVAKVMIKLNSATEMTREEMEGEFGTTTVAVAMGIKSAIDTLISTWNSLRETAAQFFKSVLGESSPQMIQTITKWVVMFGLVLGAIVPVLIMLGTLLATVAAIIPALKAVGAAVMSVFSPFVVILGVAALAFILLRNEGESTGETIIRIFAMVKKAIMFVVNNAIMPFARAFTETVKPAVMNLWSTIKKFIASARAEFRALFGGIIQAANRLAPLFRGIFSLLGKIVGAFVNAASTAFGAIVTVVGALLKPIRKIATFIIEDIVNTLISFVKLAVTLAERVGIEMPAGFKEFAAGGKFTIKEDVSVDAAAGIEKAQEAAAAASEAVAEVSAQKGAGAKAPQVKANVAIEDKRCVNVSNKVNLDGREQALAAARHKQDVNERAGFKATPWQRRIHLEQGAAPAGGLGGG